MPLTCSCDYDYDNMPGDWMYKYFFDELDFEDLDTIRAVRCKSCGKLISVGETCVKYNRFRYPYDEIESRKKTSMDLDSALGNLPEILIAPHYHCEKCGEIYMNLTTTAGFECLSPDEDMNEMLDEYKREYAPKKLN